MNWELTDNLSVTDKGTGFVIYLLKGSWTGLEEVRPIAPEGLSAVKQAELLRCGLEFAENYMLEQMYSFSCSLAA